MTFEQAMRKTRNPKDNSRVISDRVESQGEPRTCLTCVESGRAQWHWIELEEQTGSTRRKVQTVIPSDFGRA